MSGGQRVVDESRYLQGGVLDLAPGGAMNQASSPGPTELVVRVRDLSGRPIHRARVTLSRGAAAVATNTTDERGRVPFTVAAGSYRVTADYDLATDPQPAAPAHTYAGARWPSFTSDHRDAVEVAAGRTYLLTLRPDVTHNPQRPFQWQNRFIRQTLFSGAGGTDVGGAASSAAAPAPASPAAGAPAPAARGRGAPRAPADHGTRNTKLGLFLHLYSQIVAGAPRVRLLGDDALSTLRSTYGDDHTALMRRVCELLATDHGQVIVPPWVRYLVIHFSGLRYNSGPATSAHGTYEVPRNYVARLRQQELAAEVDQTPAAQLPELVTELAQALPRPDGGPYARAFAAALRGDGIWPRPTEAAHDLIAALHAPGPNVNLADLVKRVSGAMARVWADALRDDQALGILLARMAVSAPASEALWSRVIARTRLRNDVASTAWESFPAFAHGDPLSSLATASQQAWKSTQAATLLPVPSQAVCNQITEMGSAARGVTIVGGIRENACAAERGVRPSRPPDPPAPPAPAGPNPGATAPRSAAPPGGSPAASTSAAPSADQAYRLFRVDAQSLMNLREGSLVIFVGWVALAPPENLRDYGVHGADIAFMEGFAVRKSRRWLPRAGGDATGSAQTPQRLRLEDDHTDTDPMSQARIAALPWATADDLQAGPTPANRPQPALPLVEQPVTIAKLALRSGDFVLVRREATTDTRYNQYLAYRHMAIAIRPFQSTNGPRLITFETAPGPTGVTVRSLASTDLTGPGAYVATPQGAAHASLRPELLGNVLPREDQLAAQESLGGMLYAGSDGRPGNYDRD